MEDEGRQRTTKYISHRYVSQSHLLQQFTQEEERNEKLLSSGAPKPASWKKGAPKPASGKRAAPKPASGRKGAPKPASGKRGAPKTVSELQEPPKSPSLEGVAPKPASAEGRALKPASGEGMATRPRTMGTRGTSKTAPSREASPTTPPAADTPISCEDEGRDGEAGGKEGAGEKKKRGMWREGLPSLLKQTTLSFPVFQSSPAKSEDGHCKLNTTH